MAWASFSDMAILGMCAVGFWDAGSRSHRLSTATVYFDPTCERSGAIGVPYLSIMWQP